MSINTFAAVVGDNDGAAFITQAEFDSLKNDFQTQINRYNSSVDNKIDGAISNYLAGVTVAKKREVKNLVENYSDIKWIDTLKFYGSYRKFVDNLFSHSSAEHDVWYEPSLNEKRHNVRALDFMIWLLWEGAYGFGGGQILGEQDGWENGLCSWSRVPVIYVEVRKGDDGNWFLDSTNPLRFNSYITKEFWTNPTFPPRTSIQPEQTFWGATLEGFHPTNLAVFTPGDDEIFKYRIYWDAVTNPAIHRYLDWQIKKKDAHFPTAWRPDRMDGLPNMNGHAAIDDAYDLDYSMDDPHKSTWSAAQYVRTGCTFQLIDDLTLDQQLQAFRYTMLGKDTNKEVNIGYWDGSKSEGDFYDFNKSESYGKLRLKITGINMVSFRNVDPNASPDGVQLLPSPIFATLQVPHWPTASLSQLSSGLFKYQQSYLKLGQGLPLILDSTEAGVIQVTFDCKVKKILTDADYTNKKITLDVRKSDFLQKITEKTGYVNGGQGLYENVDAIADIKTLHNLDINTTDGKVQLTIPVEKDESIWLRLSPTDAASTDGIYATIENLKTTFLTMQ